MIPIDAVRASAYTVPTDEPESDGTLEWSSTTIIVVELDAGGVQGIGYTYGLAAVTDIVNSKLAGVLKGCDATEMAACRHVMSSELRNGGRPGAAMMAVSAVDIALWDLRARQLGVPVATLLGPARRAVPIYGSGGFTSYPPERVAEQLGGWAAAGIPRVKMKVGRAPADDPARLDAARAAVGDGAQLFVDANGAFTRKLALDWAERYRSEWDVRWFEEPVSSDDTEGLRLLRDRGPAGLDIAAGEYGFLLRDFRELLVAGAVDCLQADVTRCGGISGVLQVSALCDAFEIDLSGHCAPAVSAHAFSAAPRLRHLEYFHDHVRVEHLLFDGVAEPEGGCLLPDADRPGLGLELKGPDARAVPGDMRRECDGAAAHRRART